MKTDATAGGFRSPATANAFERFERRVLRGLEGETREEFRSAIVEIRERAAALAATDDRPYGLSLEHRIKQILNDPAVKKAIRGQTASPEPVISPVLPDEPAAEAQPTAPATFDRSA